jgi:hypothetical protein
MRAMPESTPPVTREILSDLGAMVELRLYQAFDARTTTVLRPDGRALAIRSTPEAGERTPAFRITVRALGDGYRVALRQRGANMHGHRQSVVEPDPEAIFWRVLEYIEVERQRWSLFHSWADD